MFIAPHLVDYARLQSSTDLQSPMVAFFSSLSAFSGTMAPAKGAARASAEMVGFMSRRTLASIDSANRMSRCRTPKDLIDEQTRFWNMAMEQFNESSARMMSAWTQAAALPAPAAAPVEVSIGAKVTTATDSAIRVHDVIKLPEAKARNVRPVASGTDREAA